MEEVALQSPDSSVPPDRLMVFWLEFLSLPETMSQSCLKHVLRVVYTTEWLAVLFPMEGRREGPHGPLQLSKNQGFCFKALLMLKGLVERTSQSKGWQDAATRLLPRGLGPVDQISFLQLLENVPLGSCWEDLLDCFCLIINPFSPSLASTFPLNTSLHILTLQRETRKHSCLPFHSCPSLSLPRVCFYK